jgi:hypothetical protein
MPYDNDGIEVLETVTGFAPMWAGTVKDEKIVGKIDHSEDIVVSEKPSRRFFIELLRDATITKYAPNNENTIKDFKKGDIITTNAHQILIGKLDQIRTGQPIRITAKGETGTHKKGQNSPFDYEVQIVNVQ